MEEAAQWRRSDGVLGVVLRQLGRGFSLPAFELFRRASRPHPLPVDVLRKEKDSFPPGNGRSRHRLPHPLRNRRTVVGLILFSRDGLFYSLLSVTI